MTEIKKQLDELLKRQGWGCLGNIDNFLLLLHGATAKPNYHDWVILVTTVRGNLINFRVIDPTRCHWNINGDENTFNQILSIIDESRGT